MSDGLRESIRELHRPVWYRSYSGWNRNEEQVWHVCGGCDEGAHAETPAGWPCRTAELVYAPEEVAAREPQVPDCPLHRHNVTGAPVSPTAVFIRRTDGTLEARRFRCDHVAGVPVVSSDPWE